MKIGDTLHLSIIDVSRGGAGVARSESGMTVFVRCSLTGDKVLARISDVKKKFANADIVEVIEPAPDRQPAVCAVFGQCGGCQWQHIPYQNQWQIKLSGVLQALKSAKVDCGHPIEEFPARQIWNYRNRVQLRGNGETLGYFAPRSHDIVNIRQCEIAHPEINAELACIRAKGQELNKPYKVELEVLADGRIRSVWNQSHGAAGFRQVNDEQNKHLKDWIKQALENPQPLMDLYGGSANLSWELAQDRDVACVDLSAPEKTPERTPPRISFYRSDILPWLKQNITEIKFNRVPHPTTTRSAIIDPPRGALGDQFNDIVERLEFLRVNEILSVGCKTDSWVRDLAKFINRGWSLQKIAAFDFFPHTVHVETAVLLKKAD